MKRRLYYKATKSLEIEKTPFIIPKHSLLTPYEIKLYKLQNYIIAGDLIEHIVKNGVEDYYGFRFEKEAENENQFDIEKYCDKSLEILEVALISAYQKEGENDIRLWR